LSAKSEHFLRKTLEPFCLRRIFSTFATAKKNPLDMKPRTNPRLLTNLIVTAAVTICYVGVGTSVIWLRHSFSDDFPPSLIITFGLACYAYGFYRLYRSYTNFQESKYEKD
jgi:hypothetical protein